MLRSMEVTVKVPMGICEDNQGVIISNTNLDSELKKKHVAILYHKLKESTSSRIVKPIKVFTMVN